MAALEREHLALCAPAEGVRDHRRNLKVRPEPCLGLLHPALSCRLVVAPEVRSKLLVADAIDTGQDRLAGRDRALAYLQEAARLSRRRLRVAGDAGAFADRPAVDVVLAPPDSRVAKASQLRAIK